MTTHRQRLEQALNHQEGAVPIDFGATAVTGIHVSCVAALRAHYGLEQRPVKAFEPYQMLGWLDDDLLEALGVSTAGVYGRNTMFGFPNENWRSWRTPWKQDVLVSGHFRTTDDGKGGHFIYPAGDTSAPPSGHMPAGGYYFDTLIRQEPLVEDRLDPRDNVEEFGPIDAADLEHFRVQAAELAAGGRGLIATFGGTAIGDIALVPAPFLRHPRGIRDIEEWYVSTVTRQDYLHAVFSCQTDIALANLARLREVVGDRVSAVFVCGTDFGTQSGTFCSPQTFLDLYAPYYRRINAWIHGHTAWRTFKHSCGAVETFYPHFIDAGFDILNPVQCSAAGMEPRRLKARYGEKLVFWGGGVDTQRTLPFGSPAQVRAEVLDRCRVFAPGGGFVFNAVHNVQAGTPVANIVAMVDAVREFNGDRG